MPKEKPSEQETPTSPPTFDRPECCHCRRHVNETGYCDDCRCWPANVTPRRVCVCGNRVTTAGWCMACSYYTLTELEPHPGEWIDTGKIPRRLTREEVSRLAKEVSATLSGPGWPEKIVPLQRRYIPRRWKRGPLKMVGKTILGFDVVLPDRVETPPDATLF